MPTTTGQSLTGLPGLPVGVAGSSYGFYFADLTGGVAGLDTLYIADDAKGLEKFSLVGGTWVLTDTTAAAAYRGLTAQTSGTTVSLFATVNGDHVVSLVDTGGYNAAFSSAPATIITAVANTAFRGISFAPNANKAPTDILVSPANAQEDSTIGTVVGPLSAIDPNVGDTFTFQLLDNAGGRFAIVGNKLTVANGLLLDFNQSASHSVTVRVTDHTNLFFDKVITIGAGDVNPENVTGDATDNVFFGGAGDDTFSGLTGNDTIRSGGGADILIGGAGNDTLDGGAGSDTVILSGNVADYSFSFDAITGSMISVDLRANSPDGTDLIKNVELIQFANATVAASSITLAAAQIFVLTGTPNADSLTGGAHAEIIYGLAGRDVLNGNGGNDILVGGLGKDRETGGTGNDTFLFNSIKETGKTAATRDVVVDFHHGQDRLDVSAFDANSKKAGNQAFKFIGTHDFDGHAGEVHYTRFNNPGTKHDVTLVEGDVNGDGHADFQIQLAGLRILSKGDFVL